MRENTQKTRTLISDGKKPSWAIKGAAEETIGSVIRSRNAWFDEECAQAVEEKNAARQVILRINTRSNRSTYKELRIKTHKLLKRKKKDALKREVLRIEELSGENESKKFFSAVKYMRTGFQPKLHGCKDKQGDILGEDSKVLQRWAEHFDELLNEGNASPEPLMNTTSEEDTTTVIDPVNLNRDEQLSSPPLLSEVEQAIKRLETIKHQEKTASRLS